MRTKEEILALATINPELDILLKTSPPAPSLGAPGTDIHQVRAGLAALKAKLTNANTSIGEIHYSEEDREIATRDGRCIKIRIHSPKTPPKDGSPIFVVYHGGGFCLGGLDNEAVLCRAFTELGGVAVNVDYRLAPEHPFPTGVNDAFDALKWTSEHLHELKVDASKGFLVGGISAGGNFAAIVPHLYQEAKLSPPLTGAYLSIPSLISSEAVPDRFKDVYLSKEQNKHAPFLNEDSINFFQGLYKSDPRSNLRSPLLFTNHSNFPPTLLQVCGMDPLRDDSLIYEQVLRENGVNTRSDIFPGLPHGFWSVWPNTEFSRDFQNKSIEGLKWLLAQSL